MMEFCKPDFLIYMGKENGGYKAVTLEELLPYGFSSGKHMT